MFYTPRSAFEMLTEVRPVVETPSKPLSKQMIQDLQLLGIRFLREPFNNPLMQNTENVMLSFPKKANESAAPGVLFFNVLCKTSYEHYDCSIDAKSDQIKLLKKTVWERSKCRDVEMREKRAQSTEVKKSDRS